jgi:predicted TIM-barrel fold metal-dependent hydrolase
MTLPIKVLDGHMHLFTAETARKESAWLALMTPAVATAARRRRERYEREQEVPAALPPEESVEDAASRWLAALDRYGVQAAVFLALAPEPETLRRFAALAPDRAFAFTFVDPWEPHAPASLEEDVLRRGFRGLKLYPPIQRFHAFDGRAYPTYERAEALSVPNVFHFGVTLDYQSDLRFANPLDLHAVGRDFPDLQLIVAHAGAGFFREALFLAYHCANVHVDTSGSGTWMRYLPRPLDLREVLKRLLDVFGGNRVLFGTHSRHASEGYRHRLLQSHRDALESLDVSDDVRGAILGGNMARLLRIPW